MSDKGEAASAPARPPQLLPAWHNRIEWECGCVTEGSNTWNHKWNNKDCRFPCEQSPLEHSAYRRCPECGRLEAECTKQPCYFVAAPPRPEAPPQIICPRCGSDNQKRIADVWECPACNLEWNAASEAVRKHGLDAVYPPSPALPEAARYQAGQAWMRSRVADVLRGDHPDLAALVEKLPLHGEDTDARVRAALQEAARATKPLRDRELEAERIPTGFMEMRLDAARPEAPRRKGRMPPCATCGHGWPMHVIPGGVENIDIYPNVRECVEDDCRCRNYVEPANERPGA